MRLVASRRRGPRNRRKPIARVRYSLGQQKSMLPLRKAKAFSCQFLRSKLTAFWVRYGNGEAIGPLKENISSRRINAAPDRRVAPSRVRHLVSVLYPSTTTASQRFAEHPTVDRAE